MRWKYYCDALSMRLFAKQAGQSNLEQLGVLLSLSSRCLVTLVANVFLCDVEVRLAGVSFHTLGKLKNGNRDMKSVLCLGM
jgi:hypothetical protein